MDTERKFREMFFEFRTSQELREEIFREDTGHSSVLQTKRNGMELSVTHLKDNGILPPHRWWNDSKKLVILYSRASVL